ncbi:integral membrane protein [Xylariomycetidae sp. FL2044]|nr:integral membrane protein [Xylariomycetidae sp. FL2044]
MPDIQDDLPTAMSMAAFAGIAWFIGVEINLSLFMLFKRRRGLYFWSCALASWGVILQPLCIILADFGVWKDLEGSITLIYLTWLIMVVPQSWVLYSRLHLIMEDSKHLRWVRLALISDSIIFSVPTIIIGILAQTTTTNPHLFSINLIWDRIQFIVFSLQETALSILYIHQTRRYLRNTALLHEPLTFHKSPSPGSTATGTSPASQRKRVLHHLIYMNILIIALDVALLGIQGAGLFYLQGGFKPCVYGIKLKVEFAILNRLIKSVRARDHNGTSGSDSYRLRAPSSGEASASCRGIWAKTRLNEPQVWATEDHIDGGVSNSHLANLPMGTGGSPWLRSQGSQSPILNDGGAVELVRVEAAK